MHDFLNTHQKSAMVLLASMYLAGILLLTQTATQAFAIAFTPIHLLLSTGILLAFHQRWPNRHKVILITFCCLFWIVEWIGVHTDLPFGPYHYGPVLGWKFADIPILIGVNWIIYLYAISIITQRMPLPGVLKVIGGASILVLLDFMIEPVAIHFNFWRWDTDDALPPLQNYISWWVLSAVALIVLNGTIKSTNSLAWFFLLCQFIFFGVLNLVIV